jgi:hypothetical protein
MNGLNTLQHGLLLLIIFCSKEHIAAKIELRRSAKDHSWHAREERLGMLRKTQHRFLRQTRPKKSELWRRPISDCALFPDEQSCSSVLPRSSVRNWTMRSGFRLCHSSIPIGFQYQTSPIIAQFMLFCPCAVREIQPVSETPKEWSPLDFRPPFPLIWTK